MLLHNKEGVWTGFWATGWPFRKETAKASRGKVPGCADSKVLRGGQVTADRPSGEEEGRP